MILPSSSNDLRFSDNFSSNNFFVLEVSDDLFDSILNSESNRNISIRGDGNENARLVTTTQTFSLVESESSNTDLIATSTSSTFDTHSSLNCLLSLEESLPSFNLVNQYLKSHMFSGTEPLSTFLPFSQLSTLAMASPSELLSHLSSLEAVCLNPSDPFSVDFSWPCDTSSIHVILSESFKKYLLDQVLMLYLEHECSQGVMDVPLILKELSPIEQTITIQLLKYYCKEISTEVVILSPEKIARYLIFKIFDQKSDRIVVEDVKLSWESNCCEFNFIPSSILTLSLLKGSVISLPVLGYNGELMQEYWCRLSSTDLPVPAGERFKTLFRLKDEWRLDELEPYISPILYKGVTMDFLLSRHARKVVGRTDLTYSKR
ncbi:hypothetical protein GEMRC1_011659 [Eukaryota sp. GEM-RC1]